ncbi:MAG: hypothetical protein J7578_04435 [Chitinophagaceae bacterium]|nr:hypothetical protein [Chitinophagaceae bacterium]
MLYPTVKRSPLFLSCLFFLFCASACSKGDAGSDNPPDPPYNGPATVIQSTSTTLDASTLVTFSDNSTQTVRFSKGALRIPLSGSGNKIIKSIKAGNDEEILIGRKEGGTISLNYDGDILRFRDPVNGAIPIGTYDEFQLINFSETTLAATYKLEADLDFMDISWTPIGKERPREAFTGNFDGNNFKISNLNIYSGNEPAGLFGYADNTKNANPPAQYIRNLTIASGSVKGGLAGAFLAKISYSNNPFNPNICVISNCVNYASINGGLAGGIAVWCGTVENCKNYGEVVSGDQGAGGIVYGAIKLDGCENFGNIKLNNDAIANPVVGGIVGRFFGSTFSNCTNHGDITVNGNALSVTVGGIVGLRLVSSNTDASVKIINSGNIVCNNVKSAVCGGLVGANAGTTIVKASFNKGNITLTGTTNYAGGIIGGLNIRNGYGFEAVYNTGNISASKIAGGLIGSYQLGEGNGGGTNTIERSYNTGTVTAITAGGVIGQDDASTNKTISNCFWKDIPTGNAIRAVGGSSVGNPATYTGSFVFSASAWPASANGWTVGNGSNGAYWKSLGNWNNGNSTYPQLYFE